MNLPGSKIAVAFDAAPDNRSGILISERLTDHLRPQFGTVAAVGSFLLSSHGVTVEWPTIGTKVLVVREDGTKIVQPEGIDAHELRVYGAWAEFQGEPMDCPWWLSVQAGYEDMAWKPYGTNVIIQPDPIEDKVGSIYLPDSAPRRNAMGTILAIGQLAEDPAYVVGDRVCFDRHKVHLLQDPDLGEAVVGDMLCVEYVLPKVEARELVGA